MKNIKRIGTKILILLLLITVVIASVPQTLAKPDYATALDTAYGVSSCTVCHNDPNGGKSLTDYGSKFKSQSGYKNDPATALKNIGTPPGVAPVVTTTVVSTPAATNAGTAVPTVTEPVVTVPKATEPKVTMPAVVETTVKPIETSEKEDDKESEKGTEAEDAREKSPGFGTITTIGIISTLYIMRRQKIGKR